ncbi:MAG TPA: hypothetical protein EYG85_07940 [Crocinitomix sp.]|nr:hypothetical protein [Crocinitomix sp.]
MKSIFFIIVTLLTVNLSLAHKTYVSIANMEYNSKVKQIEVSLKLTAHDFEHVLKAKFNKHYHIENIADTSRVGLYIQNYIKLHFKVFSEQKQCSFKYIGKEVNVRDELYFYFTFSNVINPKNILVNNTFLFELFKKQQNIIHYKYANQTKSVTLVVSNPKMKITHK